MVEGVVSVITGNTAIDLEVIFISDISSYARGFLDRGKLSRLLGWHAWSLALLSQKVRHTELSAQLSSYIA